MHGLLVGTKLANIVVEGKSSSNLRRIIMEALLNDFGRFIMRCLHVLIGLLVAPLGAFALTWDFDEGTTWGWTAQESLLGTDHGPTTVYSEVEDGVWRIAPVPRGKHPAISLVSPLIGEDSALFDWVTLRLRIIHDRPTEGNLLMAWSNGESRRRKQEAGHETRHEQVRVFVRAVSNFIPSNGKTSP